ncbi:MAG: MBL fold metallo-hydrolase, partial [Cyanobacteria bacterium J055]
MTFSHRCSAFALGLAISLAPMQSLRAQDLENVEIETVPVAEGIYMLVGEGGNIGVSVGADGAFLIDDQFAPLTEKIQAAVSALSQRPIRFILNTHWHFDHTGGNENFGRAGVTIVAHDNVR